MPAKRISIWLCALALTLWPAIARAQKARPQRYAPQVHKGEVLTLDKAWSLVPSRNYNSRIDTETVQQSKLAFWRALTSLLPTVNLSATYTLNDREIVIQGSNPYTLLLPYLDTVYNSSPSLQQYYANNPQAVDPRTIATETPPPTVIQYKNEIRGVGTVDMPILRPKSYVLLHEGNVSAYSAAYGHDALLLQLEGTLYQLYFNAVKAKRAVAVSQANVALAEVTLKSNEAELKAGAGTEYDVNSAQVTLSRAQRNLARARLEFRLSIVNLANFLDQPPVFDVRAPPELAVPPDPEALAKGMYQRRPDIRQAQEQIRLAKARVLENDMGWVPTIDARFQAYLQRGSEFLGENFRWAFYLSANWDIWDGGTRIVDHKSRQFDLTKRHLELQQLRAQIQRDFRDAALQVESQADIYKTATEEAQLSKRNFDLTRIARQAGAASPNDVQTAQQNYFLSELARVNAETNLEAAIYELYRISGRSVLSSRPQSRTR